MAIELHELARKIENRPRNLNRSIRRRSRKLYENRLTKKLGGDREKAREIMQGKHVHKTGRGLELIDRKTHGMKHGRGNTGPDGIYYKT